MVRGPVMHADVGWYMEWMGLKLATSIPIKIFFFSLMKMIKRIPSPPAPSYFFRPFYLLKSAVPCSTSHHISTTKPYSQPPSPTGRLHRPVDPHLCSSTPSCLSRSAHEPPLTLALCFVPLPHHNGTTTSSPSTITTNSMVNLKFSFYLLNF